MTDLVLSVITSMERSAHDIPKQAEGEMKVWLQTICNLDVGRG